jgi:hypothetical protein
MGAVEEALDAARGMAKRGVPLFRARPALDANGQWDPRGGHNNCGYILPKKWQTTTPNVRMVDNWQPGEALCAVMGYVVDALDVDPRNGGDKTKAAMLGAGIWPNVYGLQATTSGGTHDLVAPLGVRSRDAIRPGLDVKAGVDGQGHGFIFLAPTRKLSKVTGQVGEYRWLELPDLARLADSDDDSGEALAELIRAGRSKDPSSVTAEGDKTEPFDWERALTAGAVPEGEQRAALIGAACSLRAAVATDRMATAVLRRVVDAFTVYDEANPWTHDHADAIWTWAKAKYAPGEKPPDVTILEEFPPHLQDKARDLQAEADQVARAALDAAVAEAAQKLRVRRAAQRLVDAEDRPPAPQPDVVTLAERLAHPQPPTLYRIDGWQPAGSRVVLAAQFKAGKTTLVGNLVRCLADGAPFLGTAAVAPVDGAIVVLDLEMGERQLVGWLADQNISNRDRVYPVALRGKVAALDLLDDDVRQKWADVLRRVGAAYVVLDPLRPVLDALGLDEHREAGRFLVAFDQLLDAAGVTDALVVHHMGHSAERSRGDSRIRDWPDVEWRLVREDDNPASARYVSAYGRDVDVSESRLDYDPLTRHLTLVGGNRRDQGLDEAVEAVLAYLADNPGVTKTNLEDAVVDTGAVRSVARQAIKVAVGNGDVVVEDGPRRSKLHSLNPVRRSAPSSPPAQSSECASAPIGGALHSLLAEEPVSHPAGGALAPHDQAVANVLALIPGTTVEQEATA